jgi:hypothetical protein
MQRTVIHILLLLLAYYANAQTKGDTLYVAAHSGLSFRTEPGTKATKLAAIPKGSQLVVLADADSNLAHSVTEFPGFNIKGFWVEVDYNGQVGYVFSGYLSGFKPFEKNYDKELKKFYMEGAFYYLWRNYRLKNSINFYDQNYTMDTCYTDWSTPFAKRIVYRVENDCRAFMGPNFIEFENYTLQEVYLFYLQSRQYPCKPVWDKERNGIDIWEENIHDIIWSEDLIYPEGNKIIWRSTGGC